MLRSSLELVYIQTAVEGANSGEVVGFRVSFPPLDERCRRVRVPSVIDELGEMDFTDLIRATSSFAQINGEFLACLPIHTFAVPRYIRGRGDPG